MPKLHELSAAYAHLDSLTDDSELTDEQLLEYAQSIEDALQQKSENIAKLVQNLEVTADNIEAAEKRMYARRKAIENRVKSIKTYLLTNMVNAGITKIECAYFKLSVRDNPPSVIVDDESLIPAEYLRVPEPPPSAPDKKKLLDDIKQGVVIEGVHIERSQSLVIR